MNDERPRCEHGVVFPDEHCARCLKLENIYLDMLVAEYARKLDVLRAALAAVEYADMERRCPWCSHHMNFGHAPDCQRQLALVGVA